MRAEWGARLLVVFGTVALAVLTAVAVRVPAGAVELRGRMADDGGWTPGAIVTRVGEPLTLRMTSDDVVHGFAIGQSARPAVDLLPGTWMTTTLIFDRPGKYTYYCTRWCGPNHWRMRGTIEVTGSGARVLADSVPLFLRLKLDLDQAHPSDALPAETPTAARADGLPSPVAPDGGDLRTQSPAQVWRALRKHPVNARLTDQQLWDEVAAVWRAATSRERLAQGGQLYRDNCAACHGETGRGDGVMAKALMAGTAADPPGGEHTGMLGMSGNRGSYRLHQRAKHAGGERRVPAGQDHPRRHGHRDAVLGTDLHGVAVMGAGRSPVDFSVRLRIRCGLIWRISDDTRQRIEAGDETPLTATSHVLAPRSR